MELRLSSKRWLLGFVTRFHDERDFKVKYGFFWRDATTDEWKQLPWWTTSLDTALTLVPVNGRHRMCTLLELYSDGTGNASVIPFVGSQIWSRKRATPILALCIVALRARQAMEEE